MAEGEGADDSQKTEEPTNKRLQEARKKGQVAQSREVNNWLMIFASTMILVVFGNSIFHEMTMMLRTFLIQSYELHADPEGLGVVARETLHRIGGILFTPMLILLAAAIAGPLLQVGPLLSTESLKMDIGKISPLRGFRRLFSMRAIAEFVKSLIKLLVVGYVIYMLMEPYFAASEHFIRIEPAAALDELKYLIVRLLMGILSVMALVAILDYTYQRFEHMKNLRMSKQELKDEYKQTEGDPHIKARLRELRAMKARQRMMQAVPKADVIITNPTHYSIALKYDSKEMDAPVLVAKGVDNVAMRIRELAKEHKIPLVENPPLARALYDSVEVDQMIPTEHYKAVADVISYVFKMKNRP